MITYGKTDAGQLRPMNQDYHWESVSPVGSFPNLFIIADGMGGHNAGDFASRFAVRQFVALARNEVNMEIPALLGHLMIQVNNQLYQKSKEEPELSGMGTTMVVGTVCGDILYVANVGDSRLYVCGNELLQVTKDHSLVEEMVAEGKLEKNSDLYYSQKNIITRALGGASYVQPDVFRVSLESDEIILMCTDGLTDMVSDGQIWNILKGDGDLHQKVSQLIRMANENGGKDNITVVVIDPEPGKEELC